METKPPNYRRADCCENCPNTYTREIDEYYCYRFGLMVKYSFVCNDFGIEGDIRDV